MGSFPLHRSLNICASPYRIQSSYPKLLISAYWTYQNFCSLLGLQLTYVTHLGNYSLSRAGGSTYELPFCFVNLYVIYENICIICFVFKLFLQENKYSICYERQKSPLWIIEQGIKREYWWAVIKVIGRRENLTVETLSRRHFYLLKLRIKIRMRFEEIQTKGKYHAGEIISVKLVINWTSKMKNKV